MKIAQSYPFWLLLFFVTAGGCIDEISFESEFGESQLVVNSSIHNGPGPYTVRIGQTEPDENLIEMEPGKYQTADNNFIGQPGETYHIEIELPNGRMYFSEPETMPKQTASSTVHLEPGFVPEQTAWGGTRDVPVVFVSADTDLPESKDPIFLKWNIEGLYAFREIQFTGPFAPQANTCFITEKIDPQNILLFSASQSGSGQIKNQLLTDERVIQHKFFIRYYFNVITSSITEKRYNYWQNVDEMINQSGTIFDAPPATVPGNIKQIYPNEIPALGYFEAVVRDTSWEFVTRADFSFYISNPCGITNPDRPPSCNNCLEIKNSTHESPPYF